MNTMKTYITNGKLPVEFPTDVALSKHLIPAAATNLKVKTNKELTPWP
jgi:hypothetical protein